MQEIINDKQIRESLMERSEVLDKVKSLFLIPGHEVMTTKQVAEYFEVSQDVVKKVYRNHKDEIDSDGTMTKSYKDFLKGNDFPLEIEDNVTVQNEQVETKKGSVIITLSNEMKLEVPNRGIRCFSRRAILRIAMLLRDSRVAQEVRTQLLNVFEKTTDDVKVEDIDDEQILMGEFSKALLSGNTEETIRAFSRIQAFHNRHIEKLTEENDKLKEINQLLAEGVNLWDNRAVLNAMVRAVAYTRYGGNFTRAWGVYYKRLNYTAGIHVKARQGSGGYIDRIEPDEWITALQVAAAWLVELHIDVSQVINETNADSLKQALTE